MFTIRDANHSQQIREEKPLVKIREILDGNKEKMKDLKETNYGWSEMALRFSDDAALEGR